jgi:hypothetical protein
MLGQLAQDLVLSRTFFFQVGDPSLIGGMVRPLFVLEGGRAILEELLPASGRRPWAASRVRRRASSWAPSRADAASGRRPSLRGGVVLPLLLHGF